MELFVYFIFASHLELFVLLQVYLEQLKEEYCKELQEIGNGYSQEEYQKDQMFDNKNNPQHETEPTSCTEKGKDDAKTRENESINDSEESSKTKATNMTETGVENSSVESAVKSDVRNKAEVSVSSQNIRNTPENAFETTGEGQPIEPCQNNPAVSLSMGKAGNIKPKDKNKNIDNGPPSSKDNKANVTSKDKPIDKKSRTHASRGDKEIVKVKGDTKETDFGIHSCEENKETVKPKGKTGE